MIWIFNFIYISFIIEIILFFKIKSKFFLMLNIKKEIFNLIIYNKVSEKIILSKFFKLFKIYLYLFLIIFIITIPFILLNLKIDHTINFTSILVSIVFFITYLKIRNVIIK